MRDDTLEDDEFDFEDVDTTLDGDAPPGIESDDSLMDSAKEMGEATYELGKYLAKPSAVTVPAGAGLAALTNTPIEVGAGAGLSGAMLYRAAKESAEMGSLPDLKDSAVIGGLGAAGPVGGYAVSRADEAVGYGMEKLGDLAEMGGSAYDAATGAVSDAANYAMTEGVDLAGQAVGASDEIALGVGAGLATMMAGAYGADKVSNYLEEDESWEEDEYDI
jgi:hypothetical protein